MHPKSGYSQGQAAALFEEFDLATWNLDGGDLSRFAYINTSQLFPHAFRSDILAERHIELPMQAILDRLMATHRGGELPGREFPAHDVVPHLVA